MDEIWQRHKSFILQVIVGGVIFLVAFFVMQSIYGDANDPAKASTANAGRKTELEKKVSQGHAPTMSRIAEQRAIADRGETMKWGLAKRVSSVVGREAKLSEADRERAYVAENVQWTIANIQGQDRQYVELWTRFPQVALSQLRDAARQVVVGRAAQSGKVIDESLGLSGGVEDEDIPEAMHGLAIVTDIVVRCLDRAGIERVEAIRINPDSTFAMNQEITFISAVGVHVEIVGSPADVLAVIRSFNAVDKKEQRMTVLESIEYIQPVTADEDTVRASINVAGLRYKAAEKPAEGR